MNTIIKNIRRKSLVIIMICITTVAQAQSDTVRMLNELIKLDGVHTTTTHLRFVTDYYYREVVDAAEVKDTMEFAYMISNNKFRISDDAGAVLSLQNASYHMTFYDEDSMVMIEQPIQIYKRVFQMDFYNEQIREMNIANIQLTDSAHTRRILITGLPEAMLHSYNILYDTTNYHIIRIEYNLRKQEYSTGSPYANPDLISVKIVFKDYTEGSYDESTFEDMFYFFVREGAVYKPGMLCGNCEIIDLTNQE